MTLPQALRLSDYIRRKNKPSHVGSHGNGWVDIEILLGTSNRETPFIYLSSLCLTKEDILADDWEAKGQTNANQD